METIFRLFMFIFPFAVSLALYAWMTMRAKRVPAKYHRLAAFLIIGAGLLYTLYRLIRLAGSILTDDLFHFEILIITIIVLFFAAMAIAFGEPEK